MNFFLFPQGQDPVVANAFLVRLATLASVMAMELIDSGTTAITYSLIDKATGLKLIKVLASVKDLSSIHRHNLKKIAGGGIDDELTRLKLRTAKEYLTWWDCDVKNYSSDNSVECVQVNEGEEMEACGRVSPIFC